VELLGVVKTPTLRAGLVLVAGLAAPLFSGSTMMCSQLSP
jgi:hypothetical protein